jgi:regulator of protease activity HflC (stomatin/prohibitin superfamily)
MICKQVYAHPNSLHEAIQYDFVLLLQFLQLLGIREAEGIKEAKELEAQGEARAIEEIAKAEQNRIG